MTLIPLVLCAATASATVTVKVDGRIEADEWRSAAEYYGVVTPDGETFPSEVHVYARKDKANAYVAVRSAVPPRGLLSRVMKGAPGRLAAIDDAVLLKLDDGRVVCVNANGAVAAVKEKGKGKSEKVWWESPGFSCGSTVTNGWWDFECAIPLKEIGDEAKFDVGRRFARAEKGRVANAFVRLGRSLFPADGQPVVRVSNVSGGTSAFTVSGSVVNPSAAASKFHFELRAKPTDSQPAALVRDFKLEPGAVQPFVLKGAILGDEAVRLTSSFRNWTIHPNNETDPFAKDASAAECLLCKFAYYPSYNKFHVRIAVNNVPDWRRDVKGVRIRILDSKEHGIFEQVLQPDAEGRIEQIVDIPDLRPLTVKSGDPIYLFRVSLDGLAGTAFEKKFHRYAMEWEGNKYGLSDIVVQPFTPIEVKEKGKGKSEKVWTANTILREHELNSIGLFRQVKCPAKEGDLEPTRPIFAGDGMALVATVDGREIPLAGKLSVESSASKVLRRWTSSIDTAGIVAKTAAEFEYDGQLDWRLTLERGKFDALKLVIPLRSAEARLFHAVADTQGRNDAGDIPSGTGRVWDSRRAPCRRDIIGTFLPYVWVGGPLRGMSVYADSDKGWELGEVKSKSEKGKSAEVPCFEIVRRENGDILLVANLGQKPFEVKEPRTIRLGFMATPVKPMRKDWRSWSRGDFVGAGVMWGAGPVDADVQPFDGTTEFWEKFAEARDTGKVDETYLTNAIARCRYPGKPGDKAYENRRGSIAHHFRAGLRQAAQLRRKNASVWYMNARGVDYGIPSGMTYCDEWNRNTFLDMEREFDCCSHRDYALDPVESFRDYAAWWYRLMITTRACDRYYWDVVQPKPNFDPVGTETYYLPDGRIQGSEGMFSMRALIKRAATVQAELGADPTGNWIHMTNTAIAPNSAFAGVHYDLEDEVAPLAFQEKYPLGLMQASVIGRQFGVKVGLMAYFSAQTKEKSAWYQRTGAGMVLTHELEWRWNSTVWQKVHKDLCAWGYRTPSVRVWNYWNEDEPYPVEVKGLGKNASIVMLKDDGTARIVVSDYAGKGGTFTVRPDRKLLKLKDDFTAFDAETGKALAVKDGEIVLEVPPFDFKVVGLK